MEQAKMFLGPDLVVENVIVDEKLPDGSALMEVTLQDPNGRKRTEFVSQKMFESVVKNESTDATSFRDARTMPVVSEILGVLLKWGIRVDEIEYIMARLTNSINFNLKEADAKVWGKGRGEINLIDMDKILRKVTVEDVVGGSQ